MDEHRSREELLDENEELRERIRQLERVLGGHPVFSSSGDVEISRLQAMESELRLTKFCVDNLAAPAFWIGPDGRFLYANQAASRTLGYGNGELLAMDVWDIDPGVTPDTWPGMWEDLKARGSDTIESQHKTADGRLVPVEIRGYHFEFEGKEHVCAFAHDITQRRRAQQALRESEERFRNVVSASPMGIHMYRLEPDGTLVFSGANPAADSLLSIDHAELIGKPIEEVLPGIGDSEIPDRCREAAAHGEAWSTEHVVYQDERISGAFEVHAFQTAPGQMAVLFLDITERTRIEGRLRQSEKLEAIGQLAGGIAHDFNNQLVGIMGFADLLIRGLDNDTHRSYAEKIVKTAEKSSHLTTQLLAFARKGRYQSVAIDIHATLNDIASFLERSIDKRIKITRDLRAEAPHTEGDPTLLQNAFLNIGINARDAMPEGGELTIATADAELDESDCASLSPDAEPGRYVLVTVSDTGTGMDAPTQRKMFDPFFTTKEGGKGTGMGLAAVYGTLKLHRGAATVSSRKGHGTDFRIYLPLTEAAKAEDTPQPKTPAAARILLVDDEDIVRDVAKRMLEACGHSVTALADGVQGLEYYRNSWKDVDIVILDMVMPEMDGRQTFKAMREINPSVKALLSSGYSIDDEAQSIQNEGMLGFIQKPFLLATLRQVIADALAKD